MCQSFSYKRWTVLNLLTYFIATPSYRGWQRNEGLLLLHSFLSVDILVAFSILRFRTSAKSVSWVGLTQFNRTWRTRRCSGIVLNVYTAVVKNEPPGLLPCDWCLKHRAMRSTSNFPQFLSKCYLTECKNLENELRAITSKYKSTSGTWDSDGARMCSQY